MNVLLRNKVCVTKGVAKGSKLWNCSHMKEAEIENVSYILVFVHECKILKNVPL